MTTTASTITAAKDDFLRTIGSKVATTLFPGLCSRNTTVFLCGSAPGDRASKRSLLGQALTSGASIIKYDVVYPEELFDELLNEDLLDLENHLARSVDVVVLLLESFGAIAELGAFANHSELAGKLLCVQDKRYKRARSFISRGPLRHMRGLGPHHVVFADWDNAPATITRIRKHISAVRKQNRDKTITVDNVIHSRNFVLPCIFLLEPVHRNTLVRLMELAPNVQTGTARNAIAAALTSLTNESLVARVSHNGPRQRWSSQGAGDSGALHVYGLTQEGHERFDRSYWKRWKSAPFSSSTLDGLRFEVLAWQRRNPLVQF